MKLFKTSLRNSTSKLIILLKLFSWNLKHLSSHQTNNLSSFPIPTGSAHLKKKRRTNRLFKFVNTKYSSLFECNKFASKLTNKLSQRNEYSVKRSVRWSKGVLELRSHTYAPTESRMSMWRRTCLRMLTQVFYKR